MICIVNVAFFSEQSISKWFVFTSANSFRPTISNARNNAFDHVIKDGTTLIVQWLCSA